MHRPFLLRRSRKRIWIAVAMLILAACSSEETSSNVEVGALQLPPGFSISVFAPDVPGARSLAWSPEGVLFVGMAAGLYSSVVIATRQSVSLIRAWMSW